MKLCEITGSRLLEERNSAATFIQQQWRRHLFCTTMRKVVQEKIDRKRAAVADEEMRLAALREGVDWDEEQRRQHAYHGAQEYDAQLQDARLQHAQGISDEQPEAQQEFELQHQNHMEESNTAAVRIQSAWRKFRASENFDEISYQNDQRRAMFPAPGPMDEQWPSSPPVPGQEDTGNMQTIQDLQNSFLQGAEDPDHVEGTPRRLCSPCFPISPISSPRFRLSEVVSLHMRVRPYKYRKIL